MAWLPSHSLAQHMQTEIVTLTWMSEWILSLKYLQLGTREVVWHTDTISFKEQQALFGCELSSIVT